MKPQRIIILFDSHTPYLSFRVNALQQALVDQGLDKKLELHVILIGAGWSTYGWSINELQQQYHVPLHILSKEFHGLGLKTLFHPSVPGNCWKTLRLLFSLRPKIVMTGGYDRAEGLFALVLSYLLRFKIGVLNDSRFNDMESYSKKIWLEFIKSLVIARYDFFMLSGQESVDYHRFTGGASKLMLKDAWNVVDNDQISRDAELSDYDQAIYEHLRIPVGTSYFFLPARFVEKKNQKCALEAYAKYASSVPSPWPLILCGQGPTKAELQDEIERLGITDHVRLCDWLPYEQMPRACRLASAVLLPSHFDQWGMTVNEALSAGTPVLVSNRCGSHELVRNHVNGYTFSPEDDVHLASLMTELHRDERLLPRLRKNCLPGMESFSIRRFVDQYLVLFRHFMSVPGNK